MGIREVIQQLEEAAMDVGFWTSANEDSTQYTNAVTKLDVERKELQKRLTTLNQGRHVVEGFLLSPHPLYTAYAERWLKQAREAINNETV